MLWTVKKGLYRTQQRVMKVAAKVLPFPVPALLTGPGSVRQLADNVSVRGLRHVLVVTDKGLMDIGLPASLFESLREKGITFAVFDEVPGPVFPLICIPTTAGTGSETTVVGVITDASTHEKFAINDLKLVPKVAVLDPELMVGLPPAITAATGMDALTHAVEAYIGLNGNSFTDRHAEKATRLVFENLEKVYCDGSDLEARYQMALASTFAGAAFTRAYVGYVHAIAHNMGGLYGVAHGLANAIILPHVLTFCREQAAHKLAMLAMVAGLGARGEPDIELADRFIERIKQMNERMGIPTTIAELQAHAHFSGSTRFNALR